MPITQTRMIAVIEAATNYQLALERSISHIARTVRKQRDGQMTGQEALDEISLFATNSQWLFGSAEAFHKASETIAIENAHFRSQARRNLASAKWQAKKRAREGRTPRQTDHQREIPLSQLIAAPEGQRAQGRDLPDLSDEFDLTPKPNLAWDESDPENAFSTGQGIAELYQPSDPDRPSQDSQPRPSPLRLDTTKLNLNQDALGGNTRLRIDRQIELMDGPEGHQGTFTEPEGTGYQTRCQCGWEGRFEDWQVHQRTQTPEGSPEDSPDQEEG